MEQPKIVNGMMDILNLGLMINKKHPLSNYKVMGTLIYKKLSGGNIMIFATFQSLDYLTWKNKRFSKLKELLGVSQDANLYWCISANNIYQAIINTYTTVANQPSLFVMFETDKFYKLDAIKWNHYVETHDESLLTEDLFNIEHEDAIEYIVTSIPDKRFEVNTTPFELVNIIKDENNKYSKSILKYGSIMMQGFTNYPSREEIEKIPIATLEDDIDERLLILLKYFMAFKSFFFIPLYFAGLDYLGHTATENYNIRMLSLNETYEIVAKHSIIYMNYDNMENLYKRYKNFYEFIYNKIFAPSKIYPNEPCPCKSGLKYKKCCMKENKILYKYMTKK